MIKKSIIDIATTTIVRQYCDVITPQQQPQDDDDHFLGLFLFRY